MPSAERVGVTVGNELSLTMEQAIEMALSNNNTIDISRKDVHIAEYNLRSARGIYDPLLNSQMFYESRTTPTASVIGGTTGDSVTQRQFFGDVGLSGFVPKFGGSYDIIFNSSRIETTNRNATLNPQFPSSVTSSFIQPLWRNRSIDQNRRLIQVAAKNVDISESQLTQTAMNIIAAVELAYWDLMASLRNLQVQIETLQQAREQLESNQRLVQQGVLAPIELAAASQQIATFEQTVSIAQENVTRNENILKTLLLPDRTAVEWSRAIMPTSSPNIDIPRLGLEVATAEAMKNRPELEEVAGQVEINQIDQRFFRNQTKPQIDIVSSFTSAGLAGTRSLISPGTPPPSLIGGYPASLGRLVGFDFPTYRAGVQFSLPLRNRTAEANLGRSLTEGDRLENIRDQTEQNIEAEVRNTLQTLRAAEIRLASAIDGRVAAEELYASEQRQFRAGTVTFYFVTQRLVDLGLTRSREVQAKADLNKAVSAFNRATGRTLTVNNVTVTK
jgi:HAE1 family hydrophobic/amphiphilic exporter-1